MAIDLVGTLKQSPVFSALDETTIRKLLCKFTKVYLHKNQILFHQGEFSNSLYVVIIGRLLVIVKTEKNIERIIGEINPGDTVGELATISNEPRTATAKATDKSILLELSSAAFREICEQYPAVFQKTVNAVVDRSRDIIHLIATDVGAQKHIAVVPASNKGEIANFCAKLSSQLSNATDTVILSDYDQGFHEKFSTTKELEQHIKSLRNKITTIIYILTSVNTMLAKICFRKTEMIYVVGNADAEPYISRSVIEKINTLYSMLHVKPELILLHEKEKEMPRHTSKWLKLMRFRLNHHVRINQDGDIQRILRFMQGKAIGLVLGGGGVRSWAHFGVLRALKEASIPIDIIGGTSAGAIVAGYYALHEYIEEVPAELKELTDITSKTVSWRNFTWPCVSLFDGKAYTEKQKKIFGNVRIENLWIPSFCVSCNLSDNTQVICRNGYLWKTIRSSTAVPAIFPPVVINGDIHLDGGILNNLPVDVMRKLMGGRGIIIASELTHYSKDTNDYNFPPVLTLRQALMTKSKISNHDYKFPPFVETFLKALLAGSSAKQYENGLAADILICPDLSKYSLLSLTDEEMNEIIDLGYKSTLIAIKKWKRKRS